MKIIKLKHGDDYPTEYLKDAKRIVITHPNGRFVRIFTPMKDLNGKKAFAVETTYDWGKNTSYTNKDYIDWKKGVETILDISSFIIFGKENCDNWTVTVELNDDMKGYNTHRKSHSSKTKFVCPEKMF